MLSANPYNIRHHVESLFGAYSTLYYGDELSDDQIEGLIYAGLWHAPVWGVHIAHRLGIAFPGHIGGFGFYKSLAMFPALGAGLTYYTIGREVFSAPHRTITATGGSDGVYKPPGSYDFAFRNPISGM